MSIKNSKKIYWLLPLFVLSLLFAQSFQKEGNLLKLSDGRVIEINKEIMEDYFFFEIDNSKIPGEEGNPLTDETDQNPPSFQEEFDQDSGLHSTFTSSSPQDSEYSSSKEKPINQTLEGSFRENFDSKSTREKADQEIGDHQRYDKNSANSPALKNDTQAFDLNSVPDINLRESNPDDQLNTQSKNEPPLKKNSNINNINLNLYNLTNLLDQIFSPDKNRVKENKERTQEWEEAYQKILEKNALQVIPSTQTNAVTGDERSRLKDFIIKLPLLYELIYGDQRILPPEKPSTTQPTDAKKDDADYYKKSIELLQAILRSFPDINHQSVNVVIITNTFPQSPTPSETQDRAYFNNIDERYQQEFEGLQKKYNYNVGLELTQIKKFFIEKKYSLVLKKLHQLEKIEPYNTRIKNIIGSAYYKIGFYEFAERYWQESLNLDSNQPLVEAYLDRIREYGDSSIGDIEATTY